MDSRARSASSSRLSERGARLRDPALNEPPPREPSVRAPPVREAPSCEVSLHKQPSHESARRESGPDRSSPDCLLAGRSCPRCGFLGRGLSGCSRTPQGAAEPVPRLANATLLNCKFATLNQLFGGDAVAGPNWCGVRWPLWIWWVPMPRRSREKLWREAAGAAPVLVPKQRSGTVGVGDVLNGARA
jgi:hypothetical protein